MPTSCPDYRDSKAPTYQTVISTDKIKAPDVLQEYAEAAIDISTVPRSRYTSQAFFDQEIKQMWPKVWQMACREEEIPEEGDYIVYESPAASFIVVRCAEDTVKAFYNSCLHRGMKLCTNDSSVSQFRCPYHGFSWNLDGSLKNIPARWDFDRVSDDEMALPEARVESWGGFVFINQDEHAAPLLEYIDPLPRHFADWPRDKVYLATRLRKTINANWKACIEAFIEAFHVAELHSEAIAFGGDSSTQYDVWLEGGNVSRLLEPTGIPSDQYLVSQTQQDILANMYKAMMGDTDIPTLPEGMTAREFMANMIRKAASAADGTDYSHLSDAEAVDPAQYSVFPNLVLFRNLSYPYAYRFVPLPGDPDKTQFDFMIFKPKPSDGSLIPEVNHIELGPDDSYQQSGALAGWHGLIYDQDADNLARQQDGLKQGGTADVRFNRYQEVRLRFLHQTLMKYLEKQ